MTFKSFGGQEFPFQGIAGESYSLVEDQDISIAVEFGTAAIIDVKEYLTTGQIQPMSQLPTSEGDATWVTAFSLTAQDSSGTSHNLLISVDDPPASCDSDKVANCLHLGSIKVCKQQSRPEKTSCWKEEQRESWHVSLGNRIGCHLRMMTITMTMTAMAPQQVDDQLIVSSGDYSMGPSSSLRVSEYSTHIRVSFSNNLVTTQIDIVPPIAHSRVPSNTSLSKLSHLRINFYKVNLTPSASGLLGRSLRFDGEEKDDVNAEVRNRIETRRACLHAGVRADVQTKLERSMMRALSYSGIASEQSLRRQCRVPSIRGPFAVSHSS